MKALKDTDCCSYCGNHTFHICANCGRLVCSKCYLLYNGMIFCNDICIDNAKQKKLTE